jgi:hypothetical protein
MTSISASVPRQTHRQRSKLQFVPVYVDKRQSKHCLKHTHAQFDKMSMIQWVIYASQRIECGYNASTQRGSRDRTPEGEYDCQNILRQK